jgi:predicted MFS family arabinose efflux permease
MRKESAARMLAVVIGTIIALFMGVAAVFLVLIAINIALSRKLRSIIPPPPTAPSPAAPHHAPDSENATQ